MAETENDSDISQKLLGIAAASPLKYHEGRKSNEKYKRDNVHGYKFHPDKRKFNDKYKSATMIGGYKYNAVSKTPDEKELELEDKVFGGDIAKEFGTISDELGPIKRTKKNKLKGSDLLDKEDIYILTPKKKQPAWKDEDDEQILVKEKADALKNCPRSISSRGDENYSSYVQEKFVKLVGAPKWADLEKDESILSDDESDDEMLRKTGSFITSSTSLPKGIINIRKCKSLEDENSRGATIKSVEFHPSSKVALVAGLNSTATLYQIDGKVNSKIQSVHFDGFPLHTARFTVDGMEIVAGSRNFGHFFTYDMMAGKVIRIPTLKGMNQNNVRRFHMSPDGKYIVVFGSYGNIHLVTSKSKEWICSLKMNGDIRSLTFNADGSRMFSHGTTGEVYVWDMTTRRCIHKFADEGCLSGTALASSPNGQYLATGSDSGVVNIFDASKALASSNPTPIKRLFNLTTDVDNMKFNCTSELLAMSSSRKTNALKLVHFPSMTVFSNFPTKENNVQFVHCLDISLNSGYLALGNNKGSVFLRRLRHYANY